MISFVTEVDALVICRYTDFPINASNSMSGRFWVVAAKEKHLSTGVIREFLMPKLSVVCHVHLDLLLHSEYSQWPEIEEVKGLRGT